MTPWIAAQQASLFFTISRNVLELMCIESVMPSNHLILCHPLLLLPSIFPSIRVFSEIVQLFFLLSPIVFFPPILINFLLKNASLSQLI